MLPTLAEARGAASTKAVTTGPRDSSYLCPSDRGWEGSAPRPRRRAERCLTLAEREEISRGIARGASARTIGRTLGRSHTTISREINRCGGRGRYRAHAAEQSAWSRARRPRATKLELCGELRELVIERLEQNHSPQQIAGWLRLSYPDNDEMHVSHETIYRALYVQARGSLRLELTRHLRTRRQKRFARAHSNRGQGPGCIAGMVMNLRASTRGF